ncbi:myb domain-containing protein [Reticulomyxa filosa]|uniref:Myb domain-containing protein n=1 Tax=Reticulomyxa filosa TaxID=46433 RepID=X6NP64_RETFI|nr:myb domain-containing protein [Reticulomyxa filosa]|eukprot:ETO28070.1 myb domain-containing protein [Reticulomyxa filosa]
MEEASAESPCLSKSFATSALPTLESEQSWLEFFKYRNVSWRYLLSEKKMLQTEKEEKEEKEEEEEEEEEENKDDISKSDSDMDNENIVLAPSNGTTATTISEQCNGLTATESVTSESKKDNESNDDDSTLLCDLPIIDRDGLKRMFENSRNEYERLCQLYLTPEQIVLTAHAHTLHIT